MEPRVLFKEEQIAARVRGLAKDIADDFGSDIHMICVLKGAFVFCSDLARELSRLGKRTSIDFIVARSYSGQESSGNVNIEFNGNVKGRDVLLVEDIVDTGLTIVKLKEYLTDKGAASARLCTLLDKPSGRKTEVNIDYIGFEVPNRFVVGYGMDHDEEFRELPYIGVIE